MTLMEELANVNKATYLCAVGRLLKSLPEQEATAILEAIDNPETSPTLLSRVLAKHGYKAPRKTLTRHRLRGQKEKGCVCQ